MKPTLLSTLPLCCALFVGGLLYLSADESAQKPQAIEGAKGKAKGKGKGDDAKSEDEKKTIADLTKDAEKIPGLFTLYRDSKTGKVYLEIRKKQIGREFIYFTHTRDGIPGLGHFRGNFHEEKVFTIERSFDRVEFVAENTAFYFDRKNPLSRAAEANISRAVLASEEIAAEDEKKGTVLIDAGHVFLTESLHRVKPGKSSSKDDDRFELGSLSKDKTKFRDLRGYPENSVFVVEYVYDHPDSKGDDEQPEITDPRYVSIVLQHTLVQMPRNGYKPRFDDPRVGFFTKEVTDLTSPSPTPYRDLIGRWHLVKKDPEAKLSKPVEPITWWIENTTPVELRPTIREAALLWNEAFEAAGFKNAIAVEVQPDDADWDAGDIRYNVLRWASSPSPRYGGYGPRFFNPRTGQILAADIMFEYVFLSNRIKASDVFETAGLSQYAAREGHEAGCGLGFCMHKSNLFGAQALRARGRGNAKIEVDRLLKESLHYLVLHEIGHTLGLMHNMRASQLHGIDVIHNRKITEKEGLVGSVMDYPMINFAPKGVEQGQYYQLRPGAYDRWAIEYGYSPAAASAAAEEKRLDAIVARSTEPALAFGNDADDMRYPGAGVDPRVMIGDLSSDAVKYGAQRCELVEDLLGDLVADAGKDGESYHRVHDAYLILTGHFEDAVESMSRYVGGVYVDRAFVGQKGGKRPFTAVPEALQREAMAALDQYLFSPQAFAVEGDFYGYLQRQRRGFNFFEDKEEPRVHGRVLTMQRRVLDHLLHRRTLERVMDSGFYGNEYSLEEVLGDLTEVICEGDGKAGPNGFRRQLQVDYVRRLVGISGLKAESRYVDNAKSLAFAQLVELERFFGGKAGPELSEAAKAHRLYLAHLIEQAMEGK